MTPTSPPAGKWVISVRVAMARLRCRGLFQGYDISNSSSVVGGQLAVKLEAEL